MDATHRYDPSESNGSPSVALASPVPNGPQSKGFPSVALEEKPQSKGLLPVALPVPDVPGQGFWMNMAAWDACADLELRIEDFATESCDEGEDLSAKIDLASRCKIFKRSVAGKTHYYLFGKHYVPESVALDGEHPHYAEWVSCKFLTAIPGNEIDLGYIQHEIENDIAAFQYTSLAFDPWSALQMQQALSMQVPEDVVISIPQTVQYLSDPMKEFQAAVLSGRMHHTGDPVLRFGVSCVIAYEDAKRNIFPRKNKSGWNKINPFSAALTGFARAYAVAALQGTVSQEPLVVNPLSCMLCGAPMSADLQLCTNLSCVPPWHPRYPLLPSRADLLCVLEGLMQHARPENWDDPDEQYGDQTIAMRDAWLKADRVVEAFRQQPAPQLIGTGNGRNAKGPGLAEGRTLSGLQQQRYQHAIIYRIGDSNQQLVLTTGVLNHLINHQQIGRNAPEAGGQLFARFDGELIHVERATGPRATDRRSRFGYIPDHRAEQEEINGAHREGLHFIGDWHTHPEPRPTPSFYDVRSIRNVVAGSKHHLNGFVLLIAGTDPFPRGLFVSLYGKHAITPLILHEPVRPNGRRVPIPDMPAHAKARVVAAMRRDGFQILSGSELAEQLGQEVEKDAAL